MGVAELAASGVTGGDLAAAVESADPDDAAAVTALAGHGDASVRAAVVRQLPLLVSEPGPAQVDAVVALTRDAATEVRDWACFALGQQWRDVDTPAVRQALADRLGDEDVDTRCEALLGLAHRHDARALPAVRAALTRADGGLYLLELEAAGALSDPQLHDLVLAHLDGWQERDLPVVDAVRRLTDPAGLGQDVVDGVADLYRRRSRGEPEEAALPWWHRLAAALEIDPRRAPGALALVAEALAGDGLALAELRGNSALAQPAAALEDHLTGRR